MHENDLALVKAMLKGDEASFDFFYNGYFSKIYRFCKLHVSDSETCKDIAQQSMASAMRGLHIYRGEASLHTWLCQIG